MENQAALKKPRKTTWRETKKARQPAYSSLFTFQLPKGPNRRPELLACNTVQGRNRGTRGQVAVNIHIIRASGMPPKELWADGRWPVTMRKDQQGPAARLLIVHKKSNVRLSEPALTPASSSETPSAVKASSSRSVSASSLGTPLSAWKGGRPEEQTRNARCNHSPKAPAPSERWSRPAGKLVAA